MVIQVDLDFSQFPELEGPIVLLVGCPEGTPEKLHLLDDAVIEANAQTVEIIELNPAASSRWWVYPFHEDSMFEIFRRYTRKTYHSITKWVETDKFVSDVRIFLAKMIEEDTPLEHLPESWPELVSLVVLDESLDPRCSPYVQRVFDGWFPNAKFRESRFQGAIQPIWRSAEVTPIEEGKKPTVAEVLDWNLPSFVLLPQRAWAVLNDLGVCRVDMLVKQHAVELGEAGLTLVDLENISAELATHGLHLGMTDAQIDAIRLGVDPGHKVIETLGRMALRRPPEEDGSLAKIG